MPYSEPKATKEFEDIAETRTDSKLGWTSFLQIPTPTFFLRMESFAITQTFFHPLQERTTSVGYEMRFRGGTMR